MKIVDNTETEIGKVIDFVVDENYKLTKFILGGSAIEELKERMGLKPDDDPVVHVDHITAESDIQNRILKLDVGADHLTNKLEKAAFDSSESLFSDLRKYTVKSDDGEKVGRIVDAIVDKNKGVCFILGDSPFVEFMERIGLVADADLILPPRFITNKSDSEITISKSKSELSVTLRNQKVKDVISPDVKFRAENQVNVLQYNRNYH